MTRRSETAPLLALATRPTTSFKTGSWRFEEPHFCERLAPCREVCPLGMDIPAILEEAARGEFGEAYRLIREENPFASLCGTLGFHPCEQACNRKRFDAPVDVKNLELFLAAWARETAWVPESQAAARRDPVAVAGDDPAALAAAHFLARLGFKVSVFGPASDPRTSGLGLPAGLGQVPAGLLQWEIRQIAAQGVAWEPWPGNAKNLVARLASEFPLACLSPRFMAKLTRAQGEDSGPGIHRSADLVSGKVSLSRLSKRPALLGWDGRIPKVLSLLREAGHRPVLLLSGRLRDLPPEAEHAANAMEGGAILEKTRALYLRLETGRIRGVICRQAPGPAAEEGSAETPGRETSAIFELAAGDVILPGPLFSVPPFALPSGLKVIMPPPADPGASPSRHAVHAVAAGKAAAFSLDLCAGGHPFDRIDRFRLGRGKALCFSAFCADEQRQGFARQKAPVRFEELNVQHFRRSSRIRSKISGSDFTPRQALTTARRCFNCGRCTFCGACSTYCPEGAVEIDSRAGRRHIDYDHCKGCGICFAECPRGALGWRMKRAHCHE